MTGVDREGVLASGLFLAVASGMYILSLATGAGIVGWLTIFPVLCAAYSLYFFRDPERTAPDDPTTVVSAADGIVVDAGEVAADGFEKGRAIRVAVFMNVFNVHINRSPVAGRVVRTRRKSGKKLNAMSPRAEYENEYGDTDLETAFGFVRIRQIAGLVARRVVTRVKDGDSVERGGRIGLIRFGSRVDVFLPAGTELSVNPGDRVRAGETVIARIAPKPLF